MLKFKNFTFKPYNVVDGNLSTCWQENSKGHPQDQWIELNFDFYVSISKIEIANGFQFIDSQYGDLYYLNNRIKKQL